MIQIFDLFIDKNHMNERFRKPFISDGYACATDGCTLIRCKCEHIDFEIAEADEHVDVAKVMPKPNIRQPIDLDVIDWEALKTADEYIVEGDDEECDYCNGAGESSDVIYHKGKRYRIEFECPVCDGEGYLEAPKVPTGNKVISHETKIRINDDYFRAPLIYRLKQVRDITGFDIHCVYYKSNLKPALFVMGHFEILIMPVLGDGEAVHDIQFNHQK